jgi:hypothetical protein
MMVEGGFKMKLNSAAGCLLALGLACGSGAALAQNLVSAKAGVIHLVEGDVYLDGKPVQLKVSEFPNIKEGSLLRSGEGRAEVLLAPGGFLRMAEQSEFRMVSTQLTNASVEVTRGVVLIELADIMKEDYLTIMLRDASVSLKKSGLYRFDAESASIRVIDGEAAVDAKGQRWVLKDGRELYAENGVWTAGKFDKDSEDALYRWSKRRSSYISTANVSSAMALSGGSGYYGRGFGYSGMGYGYSGMGYGYYGQTGLGGWVYNPWLGMMTFIPVQGMLSSPFGWNYYSPYTVSQIFYPSYGNSGRPAVGNNSTHHTAGYDNNVVGTQSPRSYTSSAPAVVVPSSSPAASAPVSAPARGGADSGGRGPSTGGGATRH